MEIKDIKKKLGLGNCILNHDRKYILHPKNDDDMCWVVGIQNSPISYSKVKELGIIDDKITYFQDYVSWLEDRNTYLEEQERIRREKDKIELPF